MLYCILHIQYSIIYILYIHHIYSSIIINSHLLRTYNGPNIVQKYLQPVILSYPSYEEIAIILALQMKIRKHGKCPGSGSWWGELEHEPKRFVLEPTLVPCGPYPASVCVWGEGRTSPLFRLWRTTDLPGSIIECQRLDLALCMESVCLRSKHFIGSFRSNVICHLPPIPASHLHCTCHEHVPVTCLLGLFMFA